MNELEIKLLISSIESGKLYAVIRRIADLNSINGHRLVPQQSQSIKDSYFDTSDNTLDSKKLGLRIREVDGKRLITLKGPSKIMEAGIIERLEIESEWSAVGLTKVVDELANWEVEIALPDRNADFEQPSDVLSGLGLHVVQQRENSREVRNVLSTNGGVVLAELVIDSLVFYVKDQAIHHYEIEIEAKSKEGARILCKLTTSLRKKFPSELTVWNHSKLATIKAVEEMAAANVLESMLDGDSNLTPAAYEKIDSYLIGRDSMHS